MNLYQATAYTCQVFATWFSKCFPCASTFVVWFPEWLTEGGFHICTFGNCTFSADILFWSHMRWLQTKTLENKTFPPPSSEQWAEADASSLQLSAKAAHCKISDYPSQVRQSLLRLLSSWSSPLTKSCLTPPPSAAQIDQFVTCHPVTPLPTWDICQYKNRDQAKALTRSILNWFRTEMVLCSWNPFFNSCGCGR